MAGTSSAKGVARNAFYGVSTWLLPLGISFVATPIIVKALGHNGYGIYALVLGFIGYSFNLNTGRAVTKYVAEFSASGETGRIRGIVSTTLILNLVVGAAGAGIIALAAPWLVSRVFLIEDRSAPAAVLGFYAAAAIIFLTMQWQVFMSAVQGYQRYDLFSRLSNLSSIATIGGNLVLALLGYGLATLLAWNGAVLLLMTGLSFATARRLLPPGAITLRYETSAMRTVLRFSGGVIGYQIASNLVLLFERGWIVRQLGDEALTYYVVPMTLGIYLHGFVSSLMLVLFPLSSEIGADRERLLIMYRTATKLVLFVVAFSALALIIDSRLFLTLWIGPELAERSAPVLAVHAVTFAFAALLVVSWNMVEGLGHPSYNFGVYLICFAIAVTGMVLFTRDYGILGAALSRMAGFLVLTGSIAYVERWIFGKIQFGFWIRSMSLVAVALAASGAVLASAIRIFQPGWTLFVGSGLLAGAVYVLTAWLVGFIGEDEVAIGRRFLRRSE